jgi:hypothetical protein
MPAQRRRLPTGHAGSTTSPAHPSAATIRSPSAAEGAAPELTLKHTPTHTAAADCLMMTPGGPHDPCLALAPFLCETPEPHALEFRSATKLKEKRKQRHLERSPYARRPALKMGVGRASASVGVRRKLLEEEQQRLLGLPRGQYSQHRLSIVGKALEIL